MDYSPAAHGPVGQSGGIPEPYRPGTIDTYCEADITPTTERAPSITASPLVWIDESGRRFYQKTDTVQRRQFALLAALGLPVPEAIIDLPAERFATLESGVTLSTTLHTSHTGHTRTPRPRLGAARSSGDGLLHSAGVLLGRVHSRLDAVSRRLPDSLLATEPAHTAHITRSFIYRYKDNRHESIEETLRLASYSSYTLRSLAGLLKDVSTSLEPGTPRYDEIMYGDFKPDNLAVAFPETSQHGSLTLLDPHLARGRRLFDCAKFVSRFLLERGNWQSRERLDAFLEGYRATSKAGTRPVEPLCGGASSDSPFRQLVLMDSLNVLSSYCLCYFKGRLGYRLVRDLEDPEYTKYLKEYLSRLAAHDDQWGSSGTLD